MIEKSLELTEVTGLIKSQPLESTIKVGKKSRTGPPTNRVSHRTIQSNTIAPSPESLSTILTL
uniref:Uncharacterized protein n=1 Tax=Rhizophora mucronata TaxID=61149 RepID=A0A2P2NYP7_RHIMU